MNQSEEVITSYAQEANHNVGRAPRSLRYADRPNSGRGTWQSNPYVFAYTFELVK